MKTLWLISCNLTLFVIFATSYVTLFVGFVTLYLTMLLYLLHLQLYVIGHICDLISCEVILFLVFVILHCTVWLYISPCDVTWCICDVSLSYMITLWLSWLFLNFAVLNLTMWLLYIYCISHYFSQCDFISCIFTLYIYIYKKITFYLSVWFYF